MQSLKPKNLAERQGTSGAENLATAMHYSETTARAYQLPIDKLHPAPDEWNFYSKLPEDKMLELIESIEINGLIESISVWRKPDDTYMILSGHNRVEAYKRLYKQTNSILYTKIHATVNYGLTENQARQIIIDSNWVQRTLTPKERAKSIYNKYIILGQSKINKQERYEKIAETYELSDLQIRKYIKLNDLIDPFLEMLDESKISFENAAKLAAFNNFTQQSIYNKFKNQLSNKNISKIKPNMTVEEIENILTTNQSIISVTVKIPEHLEQSFRQMYEEWQRNNQ